ncbi:MAG: AMP-binding protein [Bacteroidales bacterium]|nr:AMP-binding protein [Bacteroidales bacterium]
MNVFDYFFETTKSLEKDFIIGPKEKVSYKDLYQNAGKLAGYISQNLPEDEKIIIVSQNSVFFLITYLAILKSGRICVPLNPDIEQSNFDYISGECNSKYIFIQEKILNRLNLDNYQIFTGQHLPEMISSNKILQPYNKFNENNCAEIIFTSGSTGIPKGVMISHRNIIANTDSIIDYLKLTQDDIIEIVLPFYYCYGLSLLHTHLKVGGSAVLNNTFIFLGSVLNDIKNYNCTGFAGVPSHFQILLRKSDSFKTTRFPKLRYVTQAGGKLHNVFIKEFVEAQPDVQFIVMYGQTEATARLSYLPVELLDSKLGSIGKGIPGVELKVVDENDNEIQPGELGEIIAKGDNIMLGYLNDDESNSKTLRNGWLHTGDLATIDDDDFIFLKSRKKEIIKVGGKRISPKEIEEVIVSIPEVIDCTISAFDDDILGEAIKASVVIDRKNIEKITEDYIRNYCGKMLAAYKVPQKIELIDRLNIASTGKKVKASQ